MKISAAQLKPVKGNIAANIEKHKVLIELAVSNNADAIFFPELSLTGYEPELAKGLATTADSPEFDIFRELSSKNNITVGLGMPTKGNNGILISMIIFLPGFPAQTYSKQQLHSDELPFFTCGNKQLILTVGNKKIAPAICYESLRESHSENAYGLGAEFYMASVAKSQKGVEKAYEHYPAVAKKFSIPVMMSNCTGYCDNFESAGQSSVWNEKGDLIGQLDDKSEGILVFDTQTGEASKYILN